VRLIFYGAGAVGSLLAARLAGTVDVLLVGRTDHVREVRAHGLRVEGVGAGTFRMASVERLVRDEPCEGVVLTVKSFDLAEAGGDLGRAIRSPVPVLALENGLGIEAVLAAQLSASGWAEAGNWVIRGINSIPVTFVRPGVVRQTGEGEIVLPGTAKGQPTRISLELHRALVTARIPVRIAPDFPREVWRKALVNAAINPVTADHGILNGQLVREPWRGQAEALLREAQAAARLAGFDFADAEADQDLWRVVRATAKNRSSMLQDLDRGRPTEIDAISGAILEEGRRHGIELPATARALARIREKAGRPLSRSPGQAL